jgi:hypothetical protein
MHPRMSDQECGQRSHVEFAQELLGFVVAPLRQWKAISLPLMAHVTLPGRPPALPEVGPEGIATRYRTAPTFVEK